jgi:anthranilate synthase component I
MHLKEVNDKGKDPAQKNGYPEKIEFHASIRHLQADTFTPVGIYLRLRDAFPQSLLLECSDYSSRHDSFSYICLRPLSGFEVSGDRFIVRQNGRETVHETISGSQSAVRLTGDFLARIKISGEHNGKVFPGLFGYTAYDAVNLFDNVALKRPGQARDPIPRMRYDLYQVVIAFNHFNNTLSICELGAEGLSPELPRVLSLLANRNATSFPFFVRGAERSLVSDERFMEMVSLGVGHCARGDVFQIVLSRGFEQDFRGDEFNVYRALRSINPSPYLFYFDYLGFKLFGSSPEAQLRVGDGRASINPIAGTVSRTGIPAKDAAMTQELLKNKKENAEHCMLVDLARNDLSKHCTEVGVDTFREVQNYSHVIHLVSTVSGKVKPGTGTYDIFGDTFPAGTLSGAPKHMALRLIDRYEETPRGFYGGAIGYIGLDSSLNHAIMIRSFMSRKGTLSYQAGAGVVIGSTPEGELDEVNGKISALRKAVQLAERFHAA